MKVDGGLLLIGAVLFLGYRLGRRRSAPPAYAPPSAWGMAPQQNVASKAKAVFAIILAVSALLFGLSMAGAEAGKLKGASKKGVPTLGAIFGALPTPGGLSIGAPFSKAKPPPRGLTFTTGAGCKPKGDWKRVDSRVRKVLTQAVKRGYSVRVSCLRTGHSKYVRGTRNVSNHHVGRGVDIDRVNGRPVRYGNRAARNLALLLGHGKLGARPSEVGSPWFGAGSFFTDSGHKDHLHVGFRRR